MAIINQDAFFSKLFQTGMTDPKSKVYLPQILLDTKSPSLNPYTMATLDLGKQTIGGVVINVLLTNIVIDGIPNVSVRPEDGGSFVLTGLDAVIAAQFCKLSPPPLGVTPTLALGGNFTLAFPGNQLTGKLSIHISEAILKAEIGLSGDQLINIITTVTSLRASVPATATISPTITFDSGGGDFWATLFTKFIKKSGTIDAIVGRVNDELNSQSVKDSLTKELTTIFQNAIRQQLNPS